MNGNAKNKSGIGQRLKMTLIILAAVMSIFQLARLIFLGLYFDSHFYQLKVGEIIFGLIRGVLFDASAYLTFIGLPLIFLNWDLPGKFGSCWVRFWFWLTFAITLMFALFLLGDILYFPYVKRHVYDELMLLGSDINAIFLTIWDAFLPHIFAFIAVVGLLTWAVSLWLPQTFYREPGAILRSFVLLLLFVSVIRGGFSQKPISIIDAYASGSSVQGDLILNGVFTAWHVALKGTSPPPKFFPEEAAIENLTHCGVDWSSEYPFEREIQRGGHSRPNVVVLLLESFFNAYVESFGGKISGLTPEFDRIARQGIRFTNFFANGQRSIEAIQGILTGFPSMSGIPDLGNGFEMVRSGSLPRYATENGYQTLFIQSSARRSFRLDSAAAALGFQRYFGREDYQLKLDYDLSVGALFGYDYEMLQLLSRQLDELDSPFFAFAFTGTMHTPFIKPPRMFREEGHGPENEIGFINTVHYTDWSIGEFFRIAQSKPWFKDTVFVLTADHTFPRFDTFDLEGRFRVPLVIVRGDEIIKDENSNRSNSIYGSHVDLLPTIFDLADWNGRPSAIGSSLLKDESRRCVFLSGRFGNPAIVTPYGSMVHSFERRLEVNADPSCDERCELQMEKSLLSFHQFLQAKYRQNKLVETGDLR